jgi:ABC-2 type transport system permease protein
VFLMSTTAGLAFASADLVVGNVEKLRQGIRTGQLDVLFIRPLGILRQLVATDFELRRLGRVVEGLVALGIAAALARVEWSVAATALVVLTVLAGMLFFGALFVAGATVTFWWIDSGEFANGFTYGGRDFTSYPITVYGTFFRRLFAFGLGFAAVAYYPTLTLLHRPDPLGLPTWTGWLAPAVAAAAATLATAAWRAGVRHYRSTGS